MSQSQRKHPSKAWDAKYVKLGIEASLSNGAILLVYKELSKNLSNLTDLNGSLIPETFRRVEDEILRRMGER